MNAEPYINLETASRFLNVKPTWMYEQVRLNRIPSYKLGKFRRFRLSELEAWMQARGSGGLLSVSQADSGN